MAAWICDRGCSKQPSHVRPSRCLHCCGFTTPDRAEALRQLREAQR